MIQGMCHELVAIANEAVVPLGITHAQGRFAETNQSSNRLERRNMRNRYMLMTVAAAMLSFAGVAYAVPVQDTLANLASDPDNSVGIGDKVFDDFDYEAAGLDGFDPNSIIVKASILGGVYYLDFAGPITIVKAGPGIKIGDLLLQYTVEAIGANSIIMIDQSYTGSATPPGKAGLTVDETVLIPSTGEVTASSHLEVGDLSDPFAEVGDDLHVNPGQKVLRVTKDIALFIDNGDQQTGISSVSISQVTQSFHQDSVPDGGMTAILLGFALTGVGLLRRKLVA